MCLVPNHDKSILNEVLLKNIIGIILLKQTKTIHVTNPLRMARLIKMV